MLNLRTLQTLALNKTSTHHFRGTTYPCYFVTLGAPPTPVISSPSGHHLPVVAVKIGDRRSTRPFHSRLSCTNRHVHTCYRVFLVYVHYTADTASPYCNIRLLVQPRHQPVHQLDVRLTAHETLPSKLRGIPKVEVKSCGTG